jgi:hypothetical protein
MLSQTTKTYSLFIATETQENHDNKRLLISTLIDNGRGKQGRCTSFTMKTTTTTEDEIQIALDYALRYLPRPDRETAVNLYQTLSTSIKLPPGNAGITVEYISSIQNPATAPLKTYIRNLAPMR